MTHTTNFKRLVCCLLAVLMLCTCVLRPLEVKASAIALGVTAAVIGIPALLYAASAGVTFVEQGVEGLAAIGKSLSETLVTYADTDEKLDELKAYLAQWAPDNFPDAPEDETPNKTKITAARWIVAGISAWIASVAVNGILWDTTGEMAPAGYSYYNGHLFPTFELLPYSEYPYQAIVSRPMYNETCYFVSKTPFVYEYMGATDWIFNTDVDTTYCSLLEGEQWDNKPYLAAGGFSFANILWSNKDLCYKYSSEVYLYGIPASPYKTAPIEPIIIRELPTLDDGTPDPDEIEKRLPATLDPWTILESTGKEDLNDAVADVMANLANGSMTYDQYMESIQSGTEVEPDPAPDGSGETETATGLRKLVDFFTGTIYVESPLTAINFTGLFDLFPFNIPAGIYQAINFWNADASTPVVELPSLGFSDGKVTGESYIVDFSEFPGMNKIAALIRAGELILFAIGLLLITRKVTKW